MEEWMDRRMVKYKKSSKVSVINVERIIISLNNSYSGFLS